MKLNIKNTLVRSSSIALLIVALISCNADLSDDINRQSETKSIYIDIEKDKVLAQARPGDEVPDFVKMYNGLSNYIVSRAGAANLTTEVSAGDEVIWQLGNVEGIKLIRFDFQVIEGQDFFQGEGASYPMEQADGSWVARISPEAASGSLIKYSVFFEIAGQGSYWWDPLMRTSGEDE